MSSLSTISDQSLPANCPQFILDMMICGGEYSFGQLWSAVLALLPPSSLNASSQAEPETPNSPWLREALCSNNQNIHCYQHYSHPESKTATGKKTNSIPAKTRTQTSSTRHLIPTSFPARPGTTHDCKPTHSTTSVTETRHLHNFGWKDRECRKCQHSWFQSQFWIFLPSLG